MRTQQVDSLRQAIDSEAKAVQLRDQELEDSLYRLRMKQNMEQHGQPLKDFVEAGREEKRKEKRRMYIRIAVLTVFLFALVFALVRRRSQRGKTD